MKISLIRCLIVFVLLTSVILLSTNASAQIAPYLTFGGNYDYDYTSKVLSFSINTADWIDYDNGEYDCLITDFGCANTDPILGATLSFGNLMNSSSNNLIFGPAPGGSTGPVDFSIDGFISATLDNFVVVGSEMMWGSLNNIQAVSGAPSSRYVDELISNGGGRGNIYMSFTPTAGGVDNFTADSSGSVGGLVAAPEPISAILFVAGGATFAFRSYRKKRI